MGNEQDRPYEEAGLIDHDEADEGEDADGLGQNPFGGEGEKQRGGETERISEDVIERIPDTEDQTKR
jgi:hypothetical protein